MILNGPGISYTEPDIGAEFVPPLPEHPREAIVKLCEHCTNRLLHRDELLGYEYWSFAEAATDEQAEVLCKMKMRRPYTLPEMVKLTGMPEADIEKMLDDMSFTGLLEYNWENPERAKQWVLPMLVPGSAEFLNMRVSQLEEHPVYAKFFEQASKGPLSKATPMVPPGGAGIPEAFHRRGDRGLDTRPIAIRPGMPADSPHCLLDGLARELSHIDMQAGAVFGDL